MYVYMERLIDIIRFYLTSFNVLFLVNVKRQSSKLQPSFNGQCLHYILTFHHYIK